TPESRTEILEGLIAQKAIANEATARGLTVSDERLRQTILGIPGLRKDDGSFDDARYKALLSAQNLTPAGFEAQLRRDLMLQSLPEAIQSSAFVPATVRDRLVALQEERREIRELRFPASDFVAKVAPTDAQLQAYYEANGRQFETAETAKIEVVVLTRDALAAQVTVSPDDLKTYYEQNKARYGSPEERRASHILVKAGPDAKAKAEKLLEQVKADPGKFETLARTASDDPGSAAQGGDLGFFQRGMMVKPFADAVFEMKQGEIRGPIETEFGQHLIRLTGAKPSAEKPFEAVRAEIEREVRTQQAGAKYAEAAQSFTDMVYEQSDSLKPVADKWKLEIRTFDGVRRQPAPDAPKGSPIANARLLGAVFGDDALRNKRNTEAVEVAPGQLAAARVLEHRPAVRRPFDEVKDTVRTRLVAEESAKLAKQAGEARLAELKAAPANVAPAGFSAPITVSRNAPEGLAQPALEAVFRIPADPVPAYGGVDLGSQGFAVVQLVKIVPTSAEALAKRQSAYDPQLQRVAAQQDVVTYVDAIKARTKIVRHPDRIAGKATDASRQP
ncbi:MAG: peptidyl-prolyl cis-trans isomerase, partial [Burkholderiaceae bacterium]